MKHKINIKKIKRWFSTIVLILFLLFNNYQTVSVLAQEASQSATIVEEVAPNSSPTASPSATQTPEPTLIPIVTPEVTPTMTVSPSPFPLELTPVVVDSATLRSPPKVRPLAKKDFRLNEPITVTVDNASAETTRAILFNSAGEEVAVGMSVVSVSAPLIYKLYAPRSLRPGRYRLKVTDASGEIHTQDFTWGVLAVNLNKSVYAPGETARLAMAVLDEAGMMVCNANLEFRIKNSELGIDDLLTTENGKIVVNPECQIKDYVEKPDYETSYKVGGAGTYQLTLSAQTKEGTHTITDGFDVRDSIPFDLERNTSTRLYPPVTYPMTFNLTAQEDFTGKLIEKVPTVFAISSPDNGARGFDDLSYATASATQSTITRSSIPQLELPFQEPHPVSLFFGQQLRDPLLKNKYAQFGLLGHDGVDFDMEIGTAVLAVDDGEVVLTEENGDYGKTIVIQHSWGKSYYGHLSEITTVVGRKKQKGFPIGISGNSGLTTGPHLHFGIKPNDNDPSNGYYGKIDPLRYLNLPGVETNGNYIYTDSYQLLTWNLSLKKGETIKLGYRYQVPQVSPQFYLLGPAQLVRGDESLAFEETRQWQLAVDVGSGSNTVLPNSGTVSTTSNTYAFTFDPSETMDSGELVINTPTGGWSTPQQNSGTVGYTTVYTDGTNTVAKSIHNGDTLSPWVEKDADTCTVNPAVDTTNKIEGTGSITCGNTGATTPDINDALLYDYGVATPADWSGFNQVGFWFRSSVDITAITVLAFRYYSNLGVTAIESYDVYTLNGSATLTGGSWYWLKPDLTAARTSVQSFGIASLANNGGLDSKDIWVDEVLIGFTTPASSSVIYFNDQDSNGINDIRIRFIDLAANGTVTITYGDGGGSSGVTNPDAPGIYTFTTKTRASATGTLDTITGSPTITLSAAGSGPTLDQLMRHGKWFNSSGVKQPFTF